MIDEEREMIVKAYVNGYRECIADLRLIGIIVPEAEAKADYLPKLIELHPKDYKLL